MKVTKDEKAHCAFTSVLVYGDDCLRQGFFREID